MCDPFYELFIDCLCNSRKYTANAFCVLLIKCKYSLQAREYEMEDRNEKIPCTWINWVRPPLEYSVEFDESSTNKQFGFATSHFPKKYRKPLFLGWPISCQSTFSSEK